MSETTVINIKTGAPYNIYIGRTMPRRGLKASIWANPFRIGQDGTREQVIERYRRMVMENRVLMERIEELRGKVLACWCAPEACHGDVLAELADPESPHESP